MKSFTITKKEAAPESLFVVEGEITAEAVDAQRKNALEKFQHMFSIDGFRSGHIPEKILLEKVGELALVEEAGSLALEKNYEEIMKEASVATIGQPKVAITKIAPGQPMGFKIETAVIPEVTLPDYKKLAKKAITKDEEVEVTEKEIEDTIKEIRMSVAHRDFHEKNPDDQSGNHDHGFKDEDLPELNDELVKKLGDFADVEDFKTKLKANLINEKQVKNREKKRLAAIEAIIAETKVEVPAVLVESELVKMIGQFKDNISGMGLAYDEYLKKVGKTEDDIRNEWKDEAKKRAIIQLVLNKISLEEKIEVKEEEVKVQVDQLLTFYKEADPLRIRIYVETMMINEKVWRFLEELK